MGEHLNWLIPTLVTVGLFLLIQAGALISILSSIKNELKHINTALDMGYLKMEKGEDKFDNHDMRLIRLETKCHNFDELLNRVTAIEKSCIKFHGGPSNRQIG